ncbi:hypothetical protein C2G38_2179909 [Gigaspora rosea]|uniref:Uncharacterized protein n=1 Tax=Gigaspora rosea TaxID=44941 RepID=A0A397VEI5_9GLOM|nr:hypothetical protein C2G38_2179909 [Gigaspora rosea]
MTAPIAKSYLKEEKHPRTSVMMAHDATSRFLKYKLTKERVRQQKELKYKKESKTKIQTGIPAQDSIYATISLQPTKERVR